MDIIRRNIMITGGAGFIGCHLVRHFVHKYPHYNIINVDKLTYAGNLANLKDIENQPNYYFEKCDITDYDGINRIVDKYNIDGVIHLAAESHVDRSIKDPFVFAKTNIIGTLTLLEIIRRKWTKSNNGYNGKLFYHISTDEVYGALDIDENRSVKPYGHDFFTENTPYKPHSPYSASKASSDHFVRAYHDTYGLPTIITNCSNNYGPYQFPEKLIPLFINNILTGRELPIYGQGNNVRDWLYVGDHVDAIDIIFHEGKPGETYNIGGFNEWKNIDLIRLLITKVDKINGNPQGYSKQLIKFVKDRAGHDLRYAIDSSKLTKELGWKPKTDFLTGIDLTINWYLNNKSWIEHITSGEYRKYYDEMYNGK